MHIMRVLEFVLDSKKKLDNDVVRTKCFMCNREGFRSEKSKEIKDSAKKFRKNTTTRCGCDARMKISLNNGIYYVYEFKEAHNHSLATGNMSQYLRSHRKVTEAQLANAEVAKSVGISNKATIDLMTKEACGPKNLGFISTDMKNHLYSKRTLKAKVGDTAGVLEYMEKKVSEDVKFIY